MPIRMLNPEDGDTMSHRNVGVFMRVDLASQTKRTTSTQIIIDYSAILVKSTSIKKMFSHNIFTVMKLTSFSHHVVVLNCK
jgi:hypothetical protein